MYHVGGVTSVLAVVVVRSRVSSAPAVMGPDWVDVCKTVGVRKCEVASAVIVGCLAADVSIV